jgi:hypothetical protein
VLGTVLSQCEVGLACGGGVGGVMPGGVAVNDPGRGIGRLGAVCLECRDWQRQSDSSRGVLSSTCGTGGVLYCWGKEISPSLN